MIDDYMTRTFEFSRLVMVGAPGTKSGSVEGPGVFKNLSTYPNRCVDSASEAAMLGIGCARKLVRVNLRVGFLGFLSQVILSQEFSSTTSVLGVKQLRTHYNLSSGCGVYA